MSRRDSRGFTILEAVVALTIVGLAGVSALEAMGGELRAAQRASDAYVVAALAQDRLAAVAMVSPRVLSPLADSLARGTFPPPFSSYRWSATTRPVPATPGLYDVAIVIGGDNREYPVSTRLFRPIPTGILR